MQPSFCNMCYSSDQANLSIAKSNFQQTWQCHDQAVHRQDKPCHPEVWILINCTGDETAYISPLAKHVGEGGGKGRGSLHRWESNFAYVAFHCETKNASDLIHTHGTASGQIQFVSANRHLCIVLYGFTCRDTRRARHKYDDKQDSRT